MLLTSERGRWAVNVPLSTVAEVGFAGVALAQPAPLTKAFGAFLLVFAQLHVTVARRSGAEVHVRSPLGRRRRVAATKGIWHRPHRYRSTIAELRVGGIGERKRAVLYYFGPTWLFHRRCARLAERVHGALGLGRALADPARPAGLPGSPQLDHLDHPFLRIDDSMVDVPLTQEAVYEALEDALGPAGGSITAHLTEEHYLHVFLVGAREDPAYLVHRPDGSVTVAFGAREGASALTSRVWEFVEGRGALPAGLEWRSEG